MALIASSTFLTLDGVMSDPHVWHPAFVSEQSITLLERQLSAATAMVVGRRTYQGLADYWPSQPDDVPLASITHRIPKIVVSSTLRNPTWNNTTVAAGPFLTEMTRLRADNGEYLVCGSASLVEQLLANGLLDEMRLYLDPVLVGSGQRLFADSPGVRPELTLTEQVRLPHGVLYLSYRVH